jgi:hypothetical protein
LNGAAKQKLISGSLIPWIQQKRKDKCFLMGTVDSIFKCKTNEEILKA